MVSCVFCDIVNDKISSHKVYETDDVLVFAPLKEDIISKGHLLVIPKKHYVDIYDIPLSEITKIFEVIKFVSNVLKEKFDVKGVNILHASGKAAQQSCFHFHMHLIPRYEDDGLDTWPETGYEEKDFFNVYNSISKLFE